MKTLGHKEKYELFLKYKKIFILLLCIFATLFLVDAIIFMIFVTYERFKIAYFINLPICILIGLCFAFSIMCISFFKSEIKFLEHIFNQYLNVIDAVIVEIGVEEVTIKGRKILKIKLIDNKEEIIVYYETSFGPIPFKENDRVLLKVADNFILEYEVK